MTELINPFKLFFLLFPLLLIFKLFLHRKQKRYNNLPPSPPRLPIIGHLHLLKEPLHEALHSLSQKFGPVIQLHFGVRRVLVVSSPSAVEECLSKNDIIFANRPGLILEKHLNYNHTTMGAAPYGPLWRNLRRITTLEVFSPTRLAMTTNTRRDEVILLVKQFVKNCFNQSGSSLVQGKMNTGVGHSETVNLKTMFSDLSTNMVSMMIMGKRYYGENVADPKVAVQFRGLMREFMLLMKLQNLGDFLPVMRWLDFQGMERRMVRLMEKMDKFLQDTVDEQRGNRQTRMKHTMIDTLLDLQVTEPEVYTDQIIKGLIMIMLIAGTESTYATMEWTMSLLLNHPDTLKKVKAEIESHVGNDHLLEEQDLKKLTHLQNVINEALRLYTPVPLLVPHHASKDCTVCGYDVPRGTMLLVNAWAIHRDPDQWADPTNFLPERFEGGDQSEGFKMIPFGAGRRGCPGAVLANRMVAMAVGALVQSFDWERTNGREEVDMASSAGLSLCKLKPLEAICRPRESMVQQFL